MIKQIRKLRKHIVLLPIFMLGMIFGFAFAFQLNGAVIYAQDEEPVVEETLPNTSNQDHDTSNTNQIEQEDSQSLDTGSTKEDENKVEAADQNKEGKNTDNTNDTNTDNDQQSKTDYTNTTDIYLNGQSGNDNNDGLTINTPLLTFNKAKELATLHQTIQNIWVTGTVNVSGNISLEGTNAILKRYNDFNDYLMQISNNETATLKNITIDGNSEKNTTTQKSLIYVNNATLNIEDGTVLQNNKIVIGNNAYAATGGAIYATKSTINMSGGTIQNNRASFGGGILVERSTLNMNGGVIQYNEATNGKDASEKYDSMAMSAGGGIAALVTSGGNSDAETIINLNDGIISHNTSDETGGGISLGYQLVFPKEKITLNMTGGTVDGNSAGSAGGGIFVQAGNTGANAVANITGGYIINNAMTGKKHDGTNAVGNIAFGGGGIYVNGYNQYFHGSFDNGVLNLENAIITNNTAKYDGGGYASCPASETHIYIRNGAAFYDNIVERYGKDIYILADTDTRDFGAHFGSPYYTISPIMLGGQYYHWKYDDGTEVPTDKLSGQLNGDEKEYLALTAGKVGNDNTHRYAQVFIYGNTSVTRGGGIGSNGTVNIGTWSPEDDLLMIKVIKNWDDFLNKDGNRPNKIKVELYRNGEFQDYGELTSDSKIPWTFTFDYLLKNDENGNPYNYTVYEHTPGYTNFIDYVNGSFVERTIKGEVNGNVAKTIKVYQNTATITNQLARNIKVIKKWVGTARNSVQIVLTAKHSKMAPLIGVLDNSNGWTYIFTDLQKYDEQGNIIQYIVEEMPLEGYTVTISGNMDDGFIITNTENKKPAPTPEKEETKKTEEVKEVKIVKTSTQTTKSNQSSQGVQTGVHTNHLLLWAMAIVSCIAGCIVSRKN